MTEVGVSRNDPNGDGAFPRVSKIVRTGKKGLDLYTETDAFFQSDLKVLLSRLERMRIRKREIEGEN